MEPMYLNSQCLNANANALADSLEANNQAFNLHRHNPNDVVYGFSVVPVADSDWELRKHNGVARPYVLASGSWESITAALRLLGIP